MAAKDRMSEDPYAVLGLNPGASDDEVSTSYRRLMRDLHPDVAGPGQEARAAAVNRAYETLRSGEAPQPQAPRDVRPDLAAAIPRLFDHRSWFTATALAVWLFTAVTLACAGQAAETTLWGAVGVGITVFCALFGVATAFLTRGLMITGLVVLGIAGMIWVQGGGWAAAAVLGAVASSVLVTMMRKRHQLLKEARAWADLVWLDGHEDHRVYMVAGIVTDGHRSTVLAYPTDDGPPDELTVWGMCEVGEWILVGPANNIIGSVPATAPRSYSRVTSARGAST